MGTHRMVVSWRTGLGNGLVPLGGVGSCPVDLRSRMDLVDCGERSLADLLGLVMR